MGKERINTPSSPENDSHLVDASPFLPYIVGGIMAAGTALYAGKKIIDVAKSRNEFVETTTVRKVLTPDQEEAFESMFSENIQLIYKYTLSQLRDEEDAQDITLKTFFRAYNKFSGFEKNPELENPYRNWLFRIAHRLILNHYRDSGRIYKHETPISLLGSKDIDHLEYDRGFSFVDKMEEPDERLQLLGPLLHTLNDREREVIMYKFYDNVSNKKIAELMHTTEGAIKSLLHRTERKLLKQIQKQQKITLKTDGYT